MGAQQAAMTLITDGSRLSGKMEGAQGTQECNDGTADGDNLTWKIEMTSPMPRTLEVSAAVDGDTIGSNVKLGAFGPATFTGARV